MSGEFVFDATAFHLLPFTDQNMINVPVRKHIKFKNDSMTNIFTIQTEKKRMNDFKTWNSEVARKPTAE